MDTTPDVTCLGVEYQENAESVVYGVCVGTETADSCGTCPSGTTCCAHNSGTHACVPEPYATDLQPFDDSMNVPFCEAATVYTLEEVLALASQDASFTMGFLAYETSGSAHGMLWMGGGHVQSLDDGCNNCGPNDLCCTHDTGYDLCIPPEFGDTCEAYIMTWGSQTSPLP